MTRADGSSRTSAKSSRTGKPAAKKPARAASGSGGGKGLRRTLVEREILERAADLFAERGYPGTTLQDVADALGMSRPSLYYYVKSKEAILGRLVERLAGEDARALDAIRRRSGTPAEKLFDMAYQVAHNAISHPKHSRILVENRHHLPPDLASADQAAERLILRCLQTVIDEGLLRGEFRDVDPRTAALSIVGMCVWTAWWITPDTVQPEALASQVASQAVASVVAASRGDRSDPADVVRALREDIDHLSRLL